MTSNLNPSLSLAPYQLCRLILPQPLERGMADPAVAGPGGEVHVTNQLRLGPLCIFGVRSGDGKVGGTGASSKVT